MKNNLYLSILRVGTIRFFRNCGIFNFYLFYFFWLLSFLFLCFGRGLVFSVGCTCSFVFFFGNFFWNAWAAGNVDPVTGLHAKKNMEDRYCVGFMCCLPMDRKYLYAVQVSLYIMISAAICIVSFMIQIFFPQARSQIHFVVYIHFLMFSLLIMSGGLYSVLSLRFLFRGEIKNYRHPAVIVSFAYIIFWVLVGFVLLPKREVRQYLMKSETLFYIFDRPSVLLIPLFAGILMLWIGGIIFKSTDIK